MELATSILIAVLTILASGGVSVFVAWRTTKAELQKEYESRFNQKKWEVYSEYALRLVTAFHHEQGFKIPSLKDEIQEMSNMILVGSDEVIKAHNNYSTSMHEMFKIRRKYSGQEYPDSPDFEVYGDKLENAIGDLFITMRNDLGYESKISHGNIISLLTTSVYITLPIDEPEPEVEEPPNT